MFSEIWSPGLLFVIKKSLPVDPGVHWRTHLPPLAGRLNLFDKLPQISAAFQRLELSPRLWYKLWLKPFGMKQKQLWIKLCLLCGLPPGTAPDMPSGLQKTAWGWSIKRHLNRQKCSIRTYFLMDNKLSLNWLCCTYVTVFYFLILLKQLASANFSNSMDILTKYDNMWAPSVKEFWLVGSRRRAFFAMATALWNICPPPGLRLAFTFLTFKSHCQMAWGPSRRASHWRWLTN